MDITPAADALRDLPASEALPILQQLRDKVNDAFQAVRYEEGMSCIQFRFVIVLLFLFVQHSSSPSHAMKISALFSFKDVITPDAKEVRIFSSSNEVLLKQ